MKPPTILIVVTEDWYFWSHRVDLARGLRDRGYGVHVATALGDLRGAIEAEGFGFTSLTLRRQGIHPWREMQSIQNLTRVMREVRPALVHLVGMKPIVYGTVAARRANVPAIVCEVAGMGYTFLAGDWRRKLIRILIRHSFRLFVAGRSNSLVIVQNVDDRQLLLSQSMAKAEQIAIIRGVGVDLNRFSPTPFPPGTPVVLAHCRLLWDKGIGELVEASRILRQRNVPARVVLVGAPDDANPASISLAQLHTWIKEKNLEWRGRRSDIPEQLASCHIACLPSYREGSPLSLMEAAACGRPIVTTDVPGCREVVKHQDNGLLVPPRDPVALADALQRLIEDAGLRQRMGERSRFLAETQFDRAHVLRDILRVYEEVLPVHLEPHPARGSLENASRRAA